MPKRKKKASVYVAKKKSLKTNFKKKTAKTVARQAKAKVNAKAKQRCALSDTEIADLAQEYADVVNESVPWRWDEIQKGISPTNRSKIREYARDNKLVNVAPLDKKQDYVTLPQGAPPFIKFPAKYVKVTVQMPKDLWLKSDAVQFRELNKAVKEKYPDYNPKTQTFAGSPKKYTWHHDQAPDGQMQLVEFGIHNMTNHTGGRNVWGGGTDFR